MPADKIECVLTTWSTDRATLQKIRREVFIDEQKFAESDEWDDDDAISIHALATLNREPVGTGRLNPGGKIGRIAVKAGLRGRGIGTLILRQLLQEAYHRGIREPYLHSQVQAVPFYGKHGFRVEGDAFDEAGVSHVRMKHALE
ncbi:MAG: GNAT family N-acetyltransferase [Steroidobacteraceae bacterium]